MTVSNLLPTFRHGMDSSILVERPYLTYLVAHHICKSYGFRTKGIVVFWLIYFICPSELLYGTTEPGFRFLDLLFASQSDYIFVVSLCTCCGNRLFVIVLVWSISIHE